MLNFICRSLIFLLLVYGSCVSERLRRIERSINRPLRSRLEVNNGMNMGSWGQTEICPWGTYAAGFSLKVEQPQGVVLFGDETGLNGIRLHCIDSSKSSSGTYEHYSTVQSDVGSWGQWTNITWCSGGFLTSFQLRVEEFGIWIDNTASNNIRFTCSGTGQVLEGSGTPWGNWGDVSNKCEGKGICGIQTNVDVPQGMFDDTAVNDVCMYCCD
ncbi:Vitelline membrane outer layer protein 1 -like protein [Triplophysa tibetana]|uniref:Vitelline membrane outer layer protein 1-like protein n=1 Tax=Triplophysa tibetana TaxID=1572043 RepID=A0A5A9PEV4_9TELE|nr:Vitelline membrane outer layer protein 1 -like protein [Triplophysa tibetana]